MTAIDVSHEPGRGQWSYKDQSASDLRFHLLEGDVAAAQFTVLERGGLSISGIQLEASIIGASHWLRIRVEGGPDVHEIFACGPVITGRSSSRLAGPRKPPLARVSLDLRHGRSYHFRAEVHSQREAEVRLDSLEARIAGIAGSAVGLAAVFPALRRDLGGGSAPRTLVLAQADESTGSMRIETAHSYPNEGRVVLSESQIGLGVAVR